MGDIYIWACVHADDANKVIYIWDMPLFISVRWGARSCPGFTLQSKNLDLGLAMRNIVHGTFMGPAWGMLWVNF